MEKINSLTSYVKCGEVFNPDLPENLDRSEAPIILGEVTIEKREVRNLIVLVKFSEFINFDILGVNPKINIIYRLVREDITLGSQILNEWNFGFEGLEAEEVANIDTSQPTVLNYCDFLNESIESAVYKLEIIQIETNNVKNYGITNKSIIAKVIEAFNGCIPYVESGEILRPVLPMNLTREDKPIELANLEVDSRINNSTVLINFSGFITSVLKGEDSNNLTFRLVKYINGSKAYILKEWAFRRVFVNNTNIKEPVVYNYCETLNSNENDKYVYKIELVEAKLSVDSYYDITNKLMTLEAYSRYRPCGHYNQKTANIPYMTCGTIVENGIFFSSVPNDRPINLAYVNVIIEDFEYLKVLINYSQNLEFEFGGENPELEMTYRLSRKNNSTGEVKVLEDFQYRVRENIGTDVTPLNTIEPLVLNYCDSVDENASFTYRVQLIDIVSKNTSFAITDREISAIVNYGN